MRMMKKCPRCGEKVIHSERRCPDCGLIFDRLDFTSNKEAKKNIRAKHKENVIYMSKLPSDIQIWRLLLLCLVTGYAGGHCLYVGRYVKGYIMFTLFFLMLLSLFIPYTVYGGFYESVVVAPLGISVFVWFFDLLFIAMGKFKVPVSIKKTSVFEVDKDKKYLKRF